MVLSTKIGKRKKKSLTYPLLSSLGPQIRSLVLVVFLGRLLDRRQVAGRSRSADAAGWSLCKGSPLGHSTTAAATGGPSSSRAEQGDVLAEVEGAQEDEEDQREEDEELSFFHGCGRGRRRRQEVGGRV